jgi:hypothetical protein
MMPRRIPALKAWQRLMGIHGIHGGSTLPTTQSVLVIAGYLLFQERVTRF